MAKVQIISADAAPIPRPTKKHGDTSIVLRRNSEYEYYFHKPMGKEDFVTYHIHSNGELLIAEYGLHDGDYIPSALYRELWESRYLYCKERMCPELPSGPPRVPRPIRESYEKARRNLRVRKGHPAAPDS